MRLTALLRADLKFLVRYDFLALYALFCLLYLLILAACPAGLRETVCTFLVFTDPAAMGLFFMGALLLLEKSQRVLPALAVSPAPAWAYVCSKALAFALAGTLVGAVLSVFSPAEVLAPRLLTLLTGGFFFSLLGMTAGLHSGSLNRFILLSTALEVLFCLPGLLGLLGMLPGWLSWHPGALIAAGLRGNPAAPLLLLPWVAAAFALTARTAGRRLTDMGGVRL